MLLCALLLNGVGDYPGFVLLEALLTGVSRLPVKCFDVSFSGRCAYFSGGSGFFSLWLAMG